MRLPGSAEFKATLIDDKAVLTDQDRKYVYIVDKDGKAQRRDITPGRLTDGLRIVQKGLNPGDSVIVDGLQKVFMPGMPVNAKTVAMTLQRHSLTDPLIRESKTWTFPRFLSTGRFSPRCCRF